MSQALNVKLPDKENSCRFLSWTSLIKKTCEFKRHASNASLCVYNGTNIFAVLLSSDFICGASVSRRKRKLFWFNEQVSCVYRSFGNLSRLDHVNDTKYKAPIYYIITYIETRTSCSYLPDAALVRLLASTDAPLFPNFVGRTQWRAGIIREKGRITARTREV